MCVLFQYKLRKIKDEALRNKINEIISETGYVLVVFNINYKCFGNILLKLVCENKKNIKIITDRGDIYLNGELVCDHSYHIAGFDDTPLKVIEILSKEIMLDKTSNKYFLDVNDNIMLVRVKFYSNARSQMPILTKQENGLAYRPHFIINGTIVHEGIQFESSSLTEFDKDGTAIVSLIYYPSVDYQDFIDGALFGIYEGMRIVGEGQIINRHYYKSISSINYDNHK